VGERTMIQSPETLRVESVVERKAPSLPRFIVIPTPALASWRLSETTVVEVRLNRVDLGRRSLKHWGRGRDCWFFDLTEAHCTKAHVETGAGVFVELRLADAKPPEEVLHVLRTDSEAPASWASLSPSARRQLSEHVRSAKRSETRVRRVRAALCLPPRIA
jgi:Bacteriocin-protection, YdeI or OmpD-Associated